MSDLDNITNTSKEFCQRVVALPDEARDNLQIRFWQKSEEKNNADYLDVVRTDIIRLSVGAQWLQNPEKSMLPDEVIRSNIQGASQRLASHAQIYQSVIGKDDVCERLITQLNNVDKALNAIPRPSEDDKPHGPR